MEKIVKSLITWPWKERGRDTSQFLALVEVQHGSKVQQWMSDAGGEYKSAAFDKMLKDKGIEILQSILYAHQQNGRAECIICILMEKAESMQFQACLPQSWWEFLVKHAVHVRECVDWGDYQSDLEGLLNL